MTEISLQLIFIWEQKQSSQMLCVGISQERLLGGGDTEVSLKGGDEGKGCFSRVGPISRMSWQEMMYV